VQAYLEQEGYSVVAVGSGGEALRVVGEEPVRLVILDLNLPDMDGLEVCRRIRARSETPVVMLTARDDETDRLAGLDSGADDYIGKPFSPRELVARMRAVLRRTGRDDEQDLLVLGDVAIRRSAREVTVAGAPVELRRKEFDLLAFLLQNRGAVLSRELLLDRVWGFDYAGGTRTVDVHVAQLRRKLDRADLIRTIRGAGYKALAP
jgi:DNA-binding response OmpR family regulator